MSPSQRSFTPPPTVQFLGAIVRRFFARESVRFILHCAALLWLLSVLRPMFSARVPRASYESPFIAWSLLKEDIPRLVEAARQPRVPALHVLFLVVPTLGFALTGRRVTWKAWESGHALRALVMAMLGLLAWSGATFEYNIYLNQGHALDRLLLVGLVALAWRTPLAVPFAARWALVMIEEAYVPIALDDFDFRPVSEVLIVFSCFVWASLRRSFNTRHFLLVALGAWASYYYAAGVAKLNYGPAGSWLLENHLSNIAVNAHVRGWLGFVADPVFLQFAAFARRFDVVLAGYTLVIEMLALVCFVHPRVLRTWLLLCFLFHAGIFLFTGICFWKWMATNLAFWFFLRRGGAPIVAKMCRQKAVVLFAIFVVYHSRQRLYYYPQTGVAWYDSRLLENYILYAVSPSGHRYLLSPSSLRPMEMHWVQGRLCYATNERSITGIYGTIGNYGVLNRLETLSTPGEALTLLSGGGRCVNPKRQEVFDQFFIRYFGNLNRHGRSLRWLRWIEMPTHLWVQPQGDLYEEQEAVARIELWREVVVHHGGALHRLETKKVHEVPIPR
jgi:hypothetical protein